ncbi:MAG: LapA family protein [Acidimicrobiia bacterium]|nr:LapA family protein [Acidimicrobiia bacterium]
MTDEPIPDEDLPGPAPEPSPLIDRSGVPWGLAIFLALVVLLALFVVQNVQDVTLRFLGWEGEYPLSVIIILVIAVSVLLDEILGGILRRRRRRRRAEKEELRRLRRSQ